MKIYNYIFCAEFPRTPSADLPRDAPAGEIDSLLPIGRIFEIIRNFLDAANRRGCTMAMRRWNQ